MTAHAKSGMEEVQLNPLSAVIDEARLLYRLHSAPVGTWEVCEHCETPWPCVPAREAFVAIATYCVRSGEPFDLRRT
jgi:RNA polymerase-binding transcription factor DksA